MEISLRLSNLSDEEFKFLRQIGVEWVDVHNPFLVSGYDTLGESYFGNVSKVLRKIRSAGLNVSSFRFSKIREALFGRPEGVKEIDNLRRLIKILGANDVPLIQIDTHSVRLSPRGVPGRFSKEHRGGYRMDAFSLEKMRKELLKKDLNSSWAHHFRNELTSDEYFENLVNLYQNIIPVLDDSDVKVAIHTDDPPVPDTEGLLPGLTTPRQIQRLLNTVPSPRSGVLFCTGTRYESGLDVFEQIEMFGSKIFHVHFRNVQGTLPVNGGYSDVMLDDGDMDMFQVLRALERVGYDGALNPDHHPDLVADTPNRNAARAFAVGYIRALLSAL